MTLTKKYEPSLLVQNQLKNLFALLDILLKEKIIQLFGSVKRFQLKGVGGGSINDSYQITTADKVLFCKTNSATKFPHLFSKEKSGLAILAQTKSIRTPTIIDCFEANGFQFLLLEWIAEGPRTESFWKKFGEQLALLHQNRNESFGLTESNYMGSVPQQNNWHRDWCSFFWEERLLPMINRCDEKGLLSNKEKYQFEQLQLKLCGLFEEEKPSLLHGDLWSGNFLCNAASEPVLIDPAVYYGHRSVDLGMTTLFGGFQRPFYESYHYHFPFSKNYEDQWAVCNLYPLLIHLYLFGRSYLSSIQQSLKRFS
jgi:protein-ribulosamine 3-kinase